MLSWLRTRATGVSISGSSPRGRHPPSTLLLAPTCRRARGTPARRSERCRCRRHSPRAPTPCCHPPPPLPRGLHGARRPRSTREQCARAPRSTRTPTRAARRGRRSGAARSASARAARASLPAMQPCNRSAVCKRRVPFEFERKPPKTAPRTWRATQMRPGQTAAAARARRPPACMARGGHVRLLGALLALLCAGLRMPCAAKAPPRGRAARAPARRRARECGCARGE